jgi:hypothetical protein
MRDDTGFSEARYPQITQIFTDSGEARAGDAWLPIRVHSCEFVVKLC